MKDIELAKELLEKNDYTLVAVKEGEVIFSSKEKGIKPMYDVATRMRDKIKDASIADRVIGRGAALLCSDLGIKELYGKLMSKAGVEILEDNNILYSYKELCNYIKNRDGSDFCPIEKLSIDVHESAIFLERLNDFFEKQNSTKLKPKEEIRLEYRTRTTNIVMSGLLLALGLIIPGIFHATGIPGTIFLPMHIPVLLGGFLLPPVYALLLGILTPILSSLITGMPPLFPMAVIMVFELGIYGLIASLLYRKLELNLIISLIISMIVGRVVAGLVVFILVQWFGQQMDPVLFVKGGVMTGLPGIVIQLIIIPGLMYLINRYTTINFD
ncbi:ECF transporter S component [Wansuia hejianensis]|uniref:DUF1893 domain-containing protein n=1 Tax=Wansuia hejianensis TaxID=2763667 RepID=A0A926EYK4_9FIRM|nr:ECF transporter S component [Wansuia hejianensis]MBC8591326.1 DUF1893 domain-containing protein [Wansuia hejianensis]